MDQAFAAANGLTNYDPSAVVTGEHSGLENPNMAAALHGCGHQDLRPGRLPPADPVLARRRDRAPPATRATSTTTRPTGPTRSTSTTRCTWPRVTRSAAPTCREPRTAAAQDTSATTCRTTPATEADILASESRIMLGHVLDNNPRVDYAHQSNLIGHPATPTRSPIGYTLLTMLSYMQNQYNAWSTPLRSSQMTDVTEAQTLQKQSAWATAEHGAGTTPPARPTAWSPSPTTAPRSTSRSPCRRAPRSTARAFGQSYGGDLSDWVDLGTGATVTLTENVAPAITSAASATSIVGAAVQLHRDHHRRAAPRRSPRPAPCRPGITFTDNGNGTATIAGTPASGSGGSYPITITATNAIGTRQPELHADQRRGPDHHQPEHRHVHHRRGRHLHGHHHRLPGAEPSPRPGRCPPG